MAVILRFDAHDLVRCRFALSPMHETIAAVRVLGHPERHPYYLPWLRLVARELAASTWVPSSP
jgi:hypothetical protein